MKLLGLYTGGSEQQRLHEGIIRLTACAVEIEHDGKKFFDSLVKSGRLDEDTTVYTLELSKKLIQLFGDDQWTAIDWQQRLELRDVPLIAAPKLIQAQAEWLQTIVAVRLVVESFLPQPA